jgi:oligopeptide/dipeptide ABC transporter ATP-binding protein
MASILEVRELHVAYRSGNGAALHAVNGVSFDVGSGEILGVLGESGSGKSTLAAALLRLLPENGAITGGSALLDGIDVLRANPLELQNIRGKRASIIYQEPSTALHPTIRVGDQINEVLRAHEPMDAAARRARTQQILRTIFSSDLDRIYSSYPHQLSGGQRQRVLIAQAIACRPALLIADEPTASLDPITQHEILALFKALRAELNLAIILIAHNPALLAGFADRIAVMYAGKIAELGPAEEILLSPQHPYTKALLRCMPRLESAGARDRKAPLPTIPGTTPNLAVLSQGCAFEPRCIDRMQLCQARDPQSVVVSDTHGVSCLKFVS